MLKKPKLFNVVLPLDHDFDVNLLWTTIAEGITYSDIVINKDIMSSINILEELYDDEYIIKIPDLNEFVYMLHSIKEVTKEYLNKHYHHTGKIVSIGCGYVVVLIEVA